MTPELARDLTLRNPVVVRRLKHIAVGGKMHPATEKLLRDLLSSSATARADWAAASAVAEVGKISEVAAQLCDRVDHP